LTRLCRGRRRTYARARAGTRLASADGTGTVAAIIVIVVIVVVVIIIVITGAAAVAATGTATRPATGTTARAAATTGVGRVAARDALIAIALVSGVLVLRTRQLTGRLLEVGVAYGAGVRTSSGISTATAVVRRSAAVRVVRSGRRIGTPTSIARVVVAALAVFFARVALVTRGANIAAAAGRFILAARRLFLATLRLRATVTALVGPASLVRAALAFLLGMNSGRIGNHGQAGAWTLPRLVGYHHRQPCQDSRQQADVLPGKFVHRCAPLLLTDIRKNLALCRTSRPALGHSAPQIHKHLPFGCLWARVHLSKSHAKIITFFALYVHGAPSGTKVVNLPRSLQPISWSACQTKVCEHHSMIGARLGQRPRGQRLERSSEKDVVDAQQWGRHAEPMDGDRLRKGMSEATSSFPECVA
jgi:hypothetical protein